MGPGYPLGGASNAAVQNISVTFQGSCGGESMSPYINGQSLSTTYVATTAAQTVTLPYLQTDQLYIHQLDLWFSNNGNTATGCDMNLIVDSVTVTSINGTVTTINPANNPWVVVDRGGTDTSGTAFDNYDVWPSSTWGNVQYWNGSMRFFLAPMPVQPTTITIIF
jgi:hypothetical protein